MEDSSSSSNINSAPNQDEDFEVEPDEEAEPYRRKWNRILLISCILLVLLVIIAIVSPLRTILFRPFSGSELQPTPTVIPGDNLFYIQEALPGTVTIDGRRVTQFLSNNIHPPIDPTLYAPIRLSSGVHHIIWQAAPFDALSCTVFVPSLANTQSCPYQSSISLVSGINVWLVTFTPTLSNLPTSQQTALKKNIQTTLDTLRSSDVVQPGEQYLRGIAASSAAPVTATQPLRATLSLHLDTDLDSSRNCVNGYGDTCTFNGQNCLQICTFSYHNGAWLAVALYYATWTYTTESSQVVAQNQPDTTSNTVGVDHSILLEVTWNEQRWHVKDVSTLSQTAQNVIGVLNTSIPACASLTGLIRSQTTYDSTSSNDHMLIQWSYDVGSDPAAGCLGVVVPSDQPQAQPAYFLYRFGILLAANSLAHRYFPNFPVADAYEQRIAQSIDQQNHLVIK
ncbi:MAG: hypothetical protein WCD86_15255 [Ktedonobacteraceae bacterium]